MKRIIAILALLACTAKADLLFDYWARSAPSAGGGGGTYTHPFLVSWVSFDSGDGSYQADKSGHGNHFWGRGGAANPTVTDGYGSFDGGDSMTNASPSLTDRDSRTIAFWVQRRARKSLQTAVSSDAAGGSSDWYLLRESSTDGVTGWKLNTYPYNYTTDALDSNTWMHITFVVGRTNAVYVNAQYISGAGGTGYTNVLSAWNIGTDGGTPSRTWVGYIDEVMLFNTNLTLAEVQTLYGSVTNGINP